MTQSNPVDHLERRLTLRDLVLFNLVAVLGISWVATAAKAGPSSITLWVLGALFFFVPQGLAVIQLAASYPEEGGIYAWTKREVGEGHGFVCGWCYWINNVLFYPTLLFSAAVAATFVIGKGESGKTVHAWAFEGDCPADFVAASNTFELEWPPRSGRMQQFPEIDRAEFFSLVEARRKINEAQIAFLDRLTEALGSK